MSNIICGVDVKDIIETNLGGLLKLLFQVHGNKVLLVDGETGEEYTAEHILKKSIRLARWLQSQGLEPGDAISIISENRIEFCLVPFAAFLTGVAVAPLNPDYSADELQHTLNLSKPTIIFCSSNILNRISNTIRSNPFIKQIVVFGKKSSTEQNMVKNFESILQELFLDVLESKEFESPNFDVSTTTATILCSSGTTGIPKGVMATHGNMTTFISIMKHFVEEFGNGEVNNKVTIGLVPFFHSMGFMILMLSLLGGQTVVVLKKFNMKMFLETIQKYKVTLLAVPPPIVVMLCQTPLLSQYDLSSVTEIKCGAAPLAKEFEKKIAKKLKLSGLHQGYGMTETTLGVLLMPPNEFKLGSVGKVVPSMCAKVIDENGNALGPNCEGELCFKGPLIMKGYVNDPVATAHTIDKDGWLHTGDIGYYDSNHYFFIVDRIKELIKYKAYQVPPAELESVLLSHPAILDAAVVGLPDNQAGELPLAYVVLKSSAKVTSEDIQNYVKGKVSPQKQLRGGVRFIDAIPRNPSGKILRRVLKKMAIETKSKL